METSCHSPIRGGVHLAHSVGAGPEGVKRMRPVANLFLPKMPLVEYVTIETDARYLAGRLKDLWAKEGTALLVDEFRFDVDWRWERVQSGGNAFHVLCVAIESNTKQELPLVQIGFEQLTASRTRIAVLWDDLGRRLAGWVVVSWLQPFVDLRIDAPAAADIAPTMPDDAPAPTIVASKSADELLADLITHKGSGSEWWRNLEEWWIQHSAAYTWPQLAEKTGYSEPHLKAMLPTKKEAESIRRNQTKSDDLPD